MYKLLSTILFTLIFSSVLSAQSIGPNIKEHDFKWWYTAAINQIDNETLSISGYFITKSTSIEWVQQSNGATETDDMPIVAKIGNWADVTSPGQMQFNVSLYGNEGKVVIQRNAVGKLTLTMEFTGTEFGDMHYLFELTNFETIN